MNTPSSLRSLSLLSLGALFALGGCNVFKASPDTAGTSTGSTVGMDHVEEGERLMDEGNRQRALEEFARAIAVNPSLTDAHMGMAYIYQQEGDYKKAETSYSRAADLAPNSFDAQYFHGLMLHLMDKVTEAISAYLRALAIKPDDFQANLNISAAYYQLGENAQALVFGERAVKLSPQSGPARVNLAAVYADMGRHEEAVTEYQQAFELIEPKPRLLLGYAESLKALNRYGEMRNTLEQLVKNAPTAAAYERLGYAYFKLEEFDKSYTAFNAALKEDPDYFPALNGVGVCELNKWAWSDKQDQAAKARGITAFRRSLALNRNQANIEELLSRYK